MELTPGQATTLHLDIDLRQRKGPQRLVCYLVEEGGAEWTYELVTTLYERARFAEFGGIHFGMVDPNVQELREMNFYLHAESLEAIPRGAVFRSESGRLRVEPGLAVDEELPDGTVVRKIPLKLRLRTPAIPGLGHASVIAEVERQGLKQQVQTGVTWSVRSFYSVAPTQVYFGKIDPSSGNPIERQATIRRTDGKPLSIKAVEVSSSCVHCSVEKASDESTCMLLLVLNPESLNGPVWGEVTVETDHALQPYVKIPVGAFVVPSK